MVQIEKYEYLIIYKAAATLGIIFHKGVFPSFSNVYISRDK